MSWLVRGVSPWRSWVALTSVRCSGQGSEVAIQIRIALCVCCDIAEHCGEAAAPQAQRFLPGSWLPPASLFQLFSPQGRGCEPQQCWHLVILRSQRKSDRQRCTVLGRALTDAGRPLLLWRPVRAQPIWRKLAATPTDGRWCGTGALDKLIAVVADPNCRQDDNEAATDNAVCEIHRVPVLPAFTRDVGGRRSARWAKFVSNTATCRASPTPWLCGCSISP